MRTAKPKAYRYRTTSGPLVVRDSPAFKDAESRDYNYEFDKGNGTFVRWGRTLEDDPQFCPVGPELLDVEISVNGCPNANRCKWCYKSNTNDPPRNMSLATFKRMLALFPKILTQVALGITGAQTNPDLLPIMRHCRKVGIIPNYTLSGIDLTDEILRETLDLAGAVAVSAYMGSKDTCYDTVAKFSCSTQPGQSVPSQTNIHLMVSRETFDFAREVLRDKLSDVRLKNLNAIVFLSVKPKGRAKEGFSPLSQEQYQELISFCLANSIKFGFDSCGAPKFEAWVREHAGAHAPAYLQQSERCESFLFSLYVNVDGKVFPCSFCEGEGDWKEGIDLLSAKDFTRDVWMHPRAVEWRKRLLGKGRECPVFEV